jgi:hypothetical protein
MSTFQPITPFPTGVASGTNSLPTMTQTFGTVLPVPLGQGWNGGVGTMQSMVPIPPLPGVVGVSSSAI